MTVAPALPARIHALKIQTACRGVPADQMPLPGHTLEDEAVQNPMPTASLPPALSNHPSNLGQSLGGNHDHETAALTWRARAHQISGRPYMRLRRYSRSMRRHIQQTDEALTPELPRRPAALRTFTGGGVAWTRAHDFDAKGYNRAAVTHTAGSFPFPTPTVRRGHTCADLGHADSGMGGRSS